MKRENMDKNSKTPLEDLKINTRIVLASLWISQFLLWTFGDMVSLLQQLNDPISNTLLASVAAPLAILQAGMIVISLIGPTRYVRILNLLVVPVFILFNIGFIAESKYAWEFILGSGYLIVNALIAVYAWKWPRCSVSEKGVSE